MGIFNLCGPALGLPFVTASLPHSPQFVRALTVSPPAAAAAAKPSLGRGDDATTTATAGTATSTDDAATTSASASTTSTSASSAPPVDELAAAAAAAAAGASTVLPLPPPPPAPFVAESRLAPLLVYLMIGAPLVAPAMTIGWIPDAAIDGVLVFVGVEGTPGWSKWPSWWRHSWPPRAPQSASESLGLLYALGRSGLAPQTTAGSDGSSSTRHPS